MALAHEVGEHEPALSTAEHRVGQAMSVGLEGQPAAKAQPHHQWSMTNPDRDPLAQRDGHAKGLTNPAY